jgi:sec-independent protein translocase protein TatA
MFSAPELMVILVIVLVIFGPKKLPDLGKGLGQAMRDFKRSLEGEEEGKLPLKSDTPPGNPEKPGDPEKPSMN